MWIKLFPQFSKSLMKPTQHIITLLVRAVGRVCS